MKRSLFFKVDAWLILIPGLLWIFLVKNRDQWMNTPCAKEGACSASEINFIDQLAIHPIHDLADIASFWTQDLAGLCAVFIPLSIHLYRKIQKLPPFEKSTSKDFLFDFTIFAQSVLITGMFTEITKIVTNRPRPYLFLKPWHQANNVHDYSSFFSGHTSFAAASCVSLIYFGVRRNLNSRAQKMIFFLSLFLTISTGVLRVWAGRHYPTDVVFGGFFGFFFASLIAFLHGPPESR